MSDFTSKIFTKFDNIIGADKKKRACMEDKEMLMECVF